jgi:hypothetical protein
MIILFSSGTYGRTFYVSTVFLGAERRSTSEVSVCVKVVVYNTSDISPADHKSKQMIAALESLRSKTNDIGKLDNCVGKALNWWSQAQVMFSTMESQAVSADDLRLSTVRIDIARRSWEAVLKGYMEYKTSVSDIRLHLVWSDSNYFSIRSVL